MRHAFVYALVFVVAPVHVGNAAAMAVPWVERHYGWWVFLVALGLYLWALAVDALRTGKVEPAVRRRHLFLHWYVFPVAGLALLHALAIAATCCGPQWAAIAESCGPPDRPPETRPGELAPPPSETAGSAGPALSALGDVVAKIVRAGVVFTRRVFLGTPWGLFAGCLFLGWLRRPAERR